jgi:Tfp pilus assembly protein PilE
MGTRKAIVTPPHRTAITRALFLELTLDLVIFAICAVVCLQVFGAAHVESTRSAALSQLGAEAQELAELFKANYGDVAVLEALPNTQREGDALVWYYDQNLLPMRGESEGEGSQPSFTLRCTINSTQPVKQAQITLLERSASDITEPILEYQVSSYRLGGGEGA